MSLRQIIIPHFQAGHLFPPGNGVSQERLVERIRSRRLRILVIDDTVDFRESMAYLLTGIFGAETVQANSGREAVELVQTVKAFNIIFLDLIIPGESALVTHEAIRHIEPSCPIVIMSAYPQSSEWKAAENRKLELIQKPLSPETLTNILSEL